MALNKYAYCFTKIAESDIDEIVTYIDNDLSNPEAASSFLDELEKQLNEICKNPKNGRPVENDYLKRDDVRRFLVKHYVAYYVIDEEKKVIAVLRVVYGKCNQDSVLNKIGK